MAQLELRNCDFFLLDRTGANYISIRIGEGTFTYTIKRDIELKKSRGQLDTAREGEQQATDVAFQFVWEHIQSSPGELPTLEEVLEGRAPNWVSASLDPNAPFSVNIQIVNNVPCSGGTNKKETYNFAEFYSTEFNHSFRDATVDCKGLSNRVRPNVVRSN